MLCARKAIHLWKYEYLGFNRQRCYLEIDVVSLRNNK